MQATSEAVQPISGAKKLKSRVQNIPDNTAANAMAPAPKKPIRRYGKADVCFTFFWVTSLLMTLRRPRIADGSGATAARSTNASARNTSGASRY
jgi:hypothetical protein